MGWRERVWWRERCARVGPKRVVSPCGRRHARPGRGINGLKTRTWKMYLTSRLKGLAVMGAMAALAAEAVPTLAMVTVEVVVIRVPSGWLSVTVVVMVGMAEKIMRTVNDGYKLV